MSTIKNKMTESKYGKLTGTSYDKNDITNPHGIVVYHILSIIRKRLRNGAPFVECRRPLTEDRENLWSVYNALTRLLLVARQNPRRHSIDAFARLKVYSRCTTIASEIASKLRWNELLSEDEHKDLIDNIGLYFADLYEVAYHPEGRR